MLRFATTGCRAHGHHEITVQLAEPSPIPNVHAYLTEYFEDAVAAGTKFVPGQIIQFGWSHLRLCERTDGTIGVEERVLSPELAWIEQVDRALRDLWYQREVVASVASLDELAFPRQDDDAMVSDCALDADAMLLLRLPAEDLPDGFSGWSLRCAADHEHDEPNLVPLLGVAAMRPVLAQFLALPHDTAVFVRYKDGRVAPHVFRRGDELAPRAGSYLAALHR
jgi:hypothetical protein